MPGPPKKRDSVRSQHDRGPKVVDLRVVAGGAIDPGDPDPEWSQETVEWWLAFWGQSELLMGLGSIDVFLVRRVAQLRELRLQALEHLDGHPMVRGSQGQLVANPLSRVLLGYDAEIRQIEDRLGLSPKARVNLGVTFGQAVKSLEEAWQE